MRAEKVRAVIYGRVSTEGQVDGTSLDDQRAIGRHAIEQRGWTYAGEFFDEGSPAPSVPARSGLPC